MTEMWFWSGDPNRSCGFKFCTFHFKEKWTTMLQKFLSLRQPTGGCKILISLPCTSKLYKKFIHFNGCSCLLYKKMYSFQHKNVSYTANQTWVFFSRPNNYRKSQEGNKFLRQRIKELDDRLFKRQKKCFWKYFRLEYYFESRCCCKVFLTKLLIVDIKLI